MRTGNKVCSSGRWPVRHGDFVVAVDLFACAWSGTFGHGYVVVVIWKREVIIVEPCGSSDCTHPSGCSFPQGVELRMF